MGTPWGTRGHAAALRWEVAQTGISLENAQGCCAKKQQGQGHPEHTGHHRQTSGSRDRNSSQGRCCCHGVRGAMGTGHSLLLYRANITAGWGCPASDLGFKGFSPGTLVPQCSLCHSPAVTQWGQGEDTELDTDKLQSPCTGAGMEQDGGCPSIPSVPCGPQELLSLHASQGQGNSSVPHISWGLCGAGTSVPLSSSLKPGEQKGCKQGAQGDTGTRDMLWGPGWPGPSPELWRNGKPKLGGPSCAQRVTVSCPLVSPRCPLGRWEVG